MDVIADVPDVALDDERSPDRSAESSTVVTGTAGEHRRSHCHHLFQEARWDDLFAADPDQVDDH